MKTFYSILTLGLLGCTTTKSPQFIYKTEPLVIAHRGASGYMPEHTLEAYEKAIEMGADFIEPDLVSTKDGILVARHENEISETTDVKIKFPDRKKEKTIDGVKVTGWFTEDFTLAELKTLRAKERLFFRNQKLNGQFQIPTFEEVLQLVKRKSESLKRTIGVYPETKHPSYFKALNLPLEDNLLKLLEQYNLHHFASPVFIQSFEVGNLKELKAKTKVKLIQLMDEKGSPFDNPGKSYKAMASKEGLKEISAYAYGIGPNKRLIVPSGVFGLKSPTSLVSDAHKAGLKVHPWTFRSDNLFLAKDYAGSPEKELIQFFELGVDGVFSDFTDTAVKARKTYTGY